MSSSPDQDKEDSLEKKYVHNFYSKKAREFSETRIGRWKHVSEWLKTEVGSYDLVLDAGCGNGRQFKRENTIGVDFSAELLAEASEKRSIGLLRTDVRTLPFQDGVFDAAISIAVIHHLQSEERRHEALREMKRVLKRGGKFLIHVWHRDAAKEGKFKAIGENEFLVGWRGEKEVRYYYLYDEEDLKKAVEAAGFDIVNVGLEDECIYIEAMS